MDMALLLEYIAAHLREELKGESPEDARRVLGGVVMRVEFSGNKTTLCNVSPCVERPKTVIPKIPL